MERYMIPYTHGVPNWDTVPVLEVSNVQWLPDAGVRMTQQLCYDEETLYIRQCAAEHDIRAEHFDPLARVCEDSCMEFFFCPDPGSDRYFNFEWNVNGCLHLGLCSGHGLSVRLQPKNTAELFHFQSAYTKGGWCISYQIPLTFIRLFFPDVHLGPGAVFRANCYKCGDLTVRPHYLSWNPCTSEQPNFHRPADFGEMLFERPTGPEQNRYQK